MWAYLLINYVCYSLSECYFAGKGTALVLPDAAETEGKKSVDDEGKLLQSGVTGPISDKTISQGNNTIQKHLQSMFYLLCPEDTLKMVSDSFYIYFKLYYLERTHKQNVKKIVWVHFSPLNLLLTSFWNVPLQFCL